MFDKIIELIHRYPFILATLTFFMGIFPKRIFLDTLEDIGIKSYSLIKGWKNLMKLLTKLLLNVKQAILLTFFALMLKFFPKQAIALIIAMLVVEILKVLIKEVEKKKLTPVT